MGKMFKLKKRQLSSSMQVLYNLITIVRTGHFLDNEQHI